MEQAPGNILIAVVLSLVVVIISLIIAWSFSGSDRKKTIKLYHYTSKDGMRGIAGSKMIKKSQNTLTDAIGGVGVYITEIQPSSGKVEIAQNNYDGAAMGARDDGRVDFVIELEIPVDMVNRLPTPKRNVWVYKGDLKLDDYPHRFLAVAK